MIFHRLGVAWLSNTVLRTVYRILHMIPEFQMAASEFSFTSADYVRDEDSNLFRYILWEKPKSEFDESPVKMILAYQAPWILSPRDMEQFASTSTKILPSYEVCITEGIRYNSAHKVWAKVSKNVKPQTSLFTVVFSFGTSASKMIVIRSF